MAPRQSIQALRKLSPEDKWAATAGMAEWDTILDAVLDPSARSRRRELQKLARHASYRRLLTHLRKIYGRTTDRTTRR